MWNLESRDMESGIHSVESGIQDSLVNHVSLFSRVKFPSTHFFWETIEYLVLETMNKGITSPLFVKQRHLIERVKCFCFCPSAFVKAVPGSMPNHISSCYLNNTFENTEYNSHNMSDCDVNDSIFLS